MTPHIYVRKLDGYWVAATLSAGVYSYYQFNNFSELLDTLNGRWWGVRSAWMRQA